MQLKNFDLPSTCLVSTPFYTILSDEDVIRMMISSPERIDGLLQKIKQTLRAREWQPPSSGEIERKRKVLEAIRQYGTFSSYFSRYFSEAYAREGDHLLCFFADFKALQSPPFAEVWRVRLEQVPAFIEKVGKLYFILVRKEVSKEVYKKLRKIGSLYPIAEEEVFHFLLLHEVYHYVHSWFYQDLRSSEAEQSVPYAIQEFNANRWATGELRKFLGAEQLRRTR